MDPIVIESLDDARVAAYRDLKDGELLRRRGLFMVEGRLSLRRLLEQSPLSPDSILLSPRGFEALEPLLVARDVAAPVYVAERPLLERIAGFDVHRGCLAACRRPAARTPQSLVEPGNGPSLVVALEALSDSENVGAVFRNAMAFGARAVLLCPRCCDPLYRRAVRVSIGASLCVPFARAERWPDDLAAFRTAGYSIVALDPGGPAVELSDLARAGDLPWRAVLLLGSEGAGLGKRVRDEADLCVRIDMVPGVDSINVATAAAIALYELRRARA